MADESKPQADGPIKEKDIIFGPNLIGKAVLVPAGTKAEDIRRHLNLQPESLILITGGAKKLDEAMKKDPALESRLSQLFSRGVARAAIEAKALIVSGGTQSGVMKLIGKGVADRGHKTPLLGVAPTGKACYPGGPQTADVDDGYDLEPNHTHFVLVEGENWGDHGDTVYALARAWAGSPSDMDKRASQADGVSDSAITGKPVPVITIVAAGSLDGTSKEEVLRSVRNGWPVIVFEGSGGLADEISKRWKLESGQDEKLDSEQKAKLRENQDLTEIVEEGEIYIFGQESEVRELLPMLARLLPVWEGEVTLRQAWTRFAIYDGRAGDYQNASDRVRKWILRLGVATTFFVLVRATLSMLYNPTAVSALDSAPPLFVQAYTGLSGWVRAWLIGDSLWRSFDVVNELLGYVVIALPILTTLLITANNQFTPGGKWILVRATAEAIKREIYSYRVRAGRYAMRETLQRQTTPQAELAARLDEITSGVMKTEMNMGRLGQHMEVVTVEQDRHKFKVAKDKDGTACRIYHDKASKPVRIRIGTKINIPTPFRTRVRDDKDLAHLKELVKAGKVEPDTIKFKVVKDEDGKAYRMLGGKAKKPFRIKIGKKIRIPTPFKTQVYKGAVKTSIPPTMYGASAGDDGFSRLTPQKYVDYRVGDQISYFDSKTVALEKEFKRYKRWTFIFAALGSLLAAVGLDLWVALTTALTAALVTFLDYRTTETTLIRYNQARTGLKNVREWWEALMPCEQREAEKVRRLVSVTERLLGTEHSGWVQEMQDALIELREGPAEPAAQGAHPGTASNNP